MESNKSVKKYIIAIVVLILLVLGLTGYIVYDKIIAKDNTEEDEKIAELITKDEAKTFLDGLVNETVNDDLLIVSTDEEIFANAIKYLFLNNKYTKEEDLFIFKQNDIIDIARKYYNNDNYSYITNDVNFTYNSENKTFSSALEFGLFESFGPKFTKTKTISDFASKEDVASFTYSVKYEYDKTDERTLVMENPEVRNYVVELIKVNNELRIKSVTLK